MRNRQNQKPNRPRENQTEAGPARRSSTCPRERRCTSVVTAATGSSAVAGTDGKGEPSQPRSRLIGCTARSAQDRGSATPNGIPGYRTRSPRLRRSMHLSNNCKNRPSCRICEAEESVTWAGRAVLPRQMSGEGGEGGEAFLGHRPKICYTHTVRVVCV